MAHFSARTISSFYAWLSVATRQAHVFDLPSADSRNERRADTLASRASTLRHTYVSLFVCTLAYVYLIAPTATLYILAKKVARVLSVPLMLHRTLASPLHQVKKKDPVWHKFDNAVPEVCLVATVIVVLKLVYGLDGKHR